jgi:hypothetical protein
MTEITQFSNDFKSRIECIAWARKQLPRMKRYGINLYLKEVVSESKSKYLLYNVWRSFCNHDHVATMVNGLTNTDPAQGIVSVYQWHVMNSRIHALTNDFLQVHANKVVSVKTDFQK